MKQAAKRVRDAKRKPREEDSSSPAATDPDELQMRQRVDELTVENEVLRRQISELQNHSTENQVSW
ncbi:hypothetical protein [Rhodoferax sp.]|uniref:hypothetical protein n=1 Tax=Rhodoferax sp. TaxID=50421 RepID=UPI002ABCCD60|nr:hypothetical protein [Rhodoferax sp.]MDZ4207784.1 hypothetical protein [Rhodoferax sp.]